MLSLFFSIIWFFKFPLYRFGESFLVTLISLSFIYIFYYKIIKQNLDLQKDITDWGEIQVRESANFQIGKYYDIYHHLFGGLNYQIEHHLFPSMCHIHYPKIYVNKTTVREICMRINNKFQYRKRPKKFYSKPLYYYLFKSDYKTLKIKHKFDVIKMTTFTIKEIFKKKFTKKLEVFL